MGGSAGKKALLNDEVINRIAQKRSISAAQVLLRWAIQRNYGMCDSKSLFYYMCIMYKFKA